MQRNAKNNLFDIAKIHLGRFLGLADSVIRGAIPQENYQVFLGLHLGLVVLESDDEVTQEILGITKHPAQLRCNLLLLVCLRHFVTAIDHRSHLFSNVSHPLTLSHRSLTSLTLSHWVSRGF